MSDDRRPGEAPPDPASANTAPSDLTRVYETPQIRVRWYASRCIHSAECIRVAPRAFNPRRRPWVDLDAATPDTIAAAVLRCPTGALQFERLDGAPAESGPEALEVRIERDGPLLLRGDIEIVDDEGRLIRRDQRVALCRCGKSRHMPFCDNTHTTIGFRDDP